MAAITTNAMADRRLPALPLDDVTPLADDWREQEGPQACTPPLRTPDPPQPELIYAELHANTLPEFAGHSNLEVAQSAEKHPAHANDKFLFTGTDDKDVDYYDHPPSSTLTSPLSADGSKAAGTGHCATGQTLGAGGAGEVGESRLPSAPPSDRQNIWGMPRHVFFIVLAVGGFMAVMGVALGAGLGIGLHKSDVTVAGSSSASSTSSLPSPTVTSLVLPSPTAKAIANKNTSIACDANNLTLYQSESNYSRRYLLLCGLNYSAADGSGDLSLGLTATFAECLDFCVKNSQCIAAAWADINGQTFCWQKTKLSTPSSAPGWYYAIEEDDVGGY